MTTMPRMPTPPKSQLPLNTCDSHTHVFGPFDQFPLSQASSYPPPDAPYQKHQQMLSTLGITRSVLVQPAPYATDTRLIVNALNRANRPQSNTKLRAIAVLNGNESETTFNDLHCAGVRGLRFVDMLTASGQRFAGSVGAEQLMPMAARLKALGWHAQLWANANSYMTLLPELTQLGIPIVLDHMGCIEVAQGVNAATFTTLLEYLAEGKIWIKLTLCRNSSHYPKYSELKPFFDAMVSANPDQLLWGSDWPFVRMGDNSPDVGVLIDQFLQWLPSPRLQQKILVDNPARLYDF